MLGKIILTTILSLSMLSMEAQKKWTLQDCMEYAAEQHLTEEVGFAETDEQ